MQCFALQGRNGIPSPAGAPTRPFAKSVSHVDTMITANGDEPNLYETQAFYGCDRLISCQVFDTLALGRQAFSSNGTGEATGSEYWIGRDGFYQPTYADRYGYRGFDIFSKSLHMPAAWL